MFMRNCWYVAAMAEEVGDGLLARTILSQPLVLFRDGLGRVAALEARLSPPLEKRDHLLTSGFSAVDIAVGQAVYMARHFAKIEGFAELSAWYARITAREAFQRSLPGPEERLYRRDFYPAWES